MFLKFILSFLFFFIPHINCNNSEFIKCCEPDRGLVNSYNKSFKCDKGINQFVLPLQNSSIIEYELPGKCSNNNLSFCVDKLINHLNGNIVELTCGNKETFKTPELPTIYKCCPDQMFYNSVTKSCDFDDTSSIDLIKDQEVVYNLVYGYPVCNKVYVEHNFKSVQFQILSGALYIVNHPAANTWFGNGTFCIDARGKNESKINEVIVVSCEASYSGVIETCKSKKACVPKCCPFGYIYKQGKIKKYDCAPEWDSPFEPPFGSDNTSNNFQLLAPPACRYGKYLTKNVSLLENGTLHSSINLYYEPFANKFCIENFNTTDKKGVYAVICFSQPKREIMKNFYYLAGLIISILFLGATLTIYFFLPELQNLHGRTVMSHTTSLLASYICLAFVKLPVTKYGPNTCLILGYGIMFTFLSAFTWLNVMCFDIWWTFGVVQARGMTKNNNLKKFVFYCIYAHGLPLLLTAIAIIVELHPDIPDMYKPKIARHSCWFYLAKGATFEYTVFFVTPVAILICCNIILFILTARHCLKIRNDIQRMQHNDSPKAKRFLADKATLLMNVKLFIVMGITWIFELISVYVREPEALWAVFDTINVLQGLWIFCIFVFKENVWKAIKKKLGYQVIREGSQTQTTSLSTKLSNASSASVKLNGIKQENKDLLRNIINKNRESFDA